MSDSRFLGLVGAGNARDLGGLPTADGRWIARGRLLRSDLLVSLCAEDERVLLGQLGLRSVIDLRTTDEVSAHPGPWQQAGIDVLRARLPLDPAFVARDAAGMVGLYLSFLEPPAPAMLAALKALIDVERHPVLIHCAAGKDRTGVLCALALELLGVSRVVIGADFALTHARMARVIKRLEAEAGRRRRAGLPDVMYSAHASTIDGFLVGLHERYGGAAAWARSGGITEAELGRFRAACVVDRADGNGW